LPLKPNPFADYNLHIEELKDHFESKDHFTTSEITKFYRSFERDLKKSTINWRVYELVKKGVLTRIGKGVFKLGESQHFTPKIDNHLKSIFRRITKELPYADVCVWETSFLNHLMLHQPSNFNTMVEAEREVTNSVFNLLRSNKYQVFLNPDREIIQNHLYDQKHYIIVKTLVSESPLQKIENVTTVTIEKILVDLFCDTILFEPYQGIERKRIYQEAFKQYSINEKTLLRYADRRKRKDELKKYLKWSELTLLHKKAPTERQRL
jgi:hypothetical protein